MMQSIWVVNMLGVAAATAALAAVTAVSAPHANADGTWAAITWSAPEGVSGTGDGVTQDQATGESTTVCTSNGGSACNVAIVAENACIAIAVDGGKVSGGTGPTLDAARSAALAANGGGAIKQAMCGGNPTGPAQQAPPKAPAGPALSWTPRPGSLTVHVTDNSGTSSVCTYTADWFRSLPFPLKANSTFDLLIAPSVPENRTWNINVNCDNGTSTQTTHFY
jgi:hypothetical protein